MYKRGIMIMLKTACILLIVLTSTYLIHLIFMSHKKEKIMHFKELALAFNDLETISSRLEMTERLASLFAQASAEEARMIAYLSLGELSAPYAPLQFGMAEKRVIPLVALVCNENENTIKESLKKYGDLGSVIGSYNREAKKNITVKEMYARLTEIAHIGGSGSQERKADLLYTLLLEVSPTEAQYVIRIVLGTLRLGFSDMTIIDALSWMLVGNKSARTIIEDGYNICADIGTIAEAAKRNDLDALKHMQITVGVPLRPAAAERLASIPDIFNKIGPCVAQPKLDGFRLQIHVNKSERLVRFYSRNLQDMSDMFPEFIKELQRINAQTFIIEGEAIAWDQNTETFLPFQETVKRKRKHNIEQMAHDVPLKLFLFDLLYCDGIDYMNKPHEKRRKALMNIVHTTETVSIIEEKTIKSINELQNYFDSSLEKGLEGLVVKRTDAIYQPGKRNFNWIKIKRYHANTLNDTVDTVIIGYYYGQGKRAQLGIGAFLVAIYNHADDIFETIAKVGTGLTDEEWKDLKKKCDKNAITKQPHNVICSKELMPDVWVSPSIICSIRADEITISPTHTAGKTMNSPGYALRFPRMVEYRNDKGVLDITSLAEIKELYELQFKKITLTS